MISGLVLKYLNGECFVIWRGYETTLLASTEFNLTVPPARLKLVLSASARRNALQERATKYCWDKQ
jgi:hypothetical protein